MYNKPLWWPYVESVSLWQQRAVLYDFHQLSDHLTDRQPRLELSASTTIALMATNQGVDLEEAVLLDTGCSQHIFQSKCFFHNLHEFAAGDTSHPISGVGGTVVFATGVGTVRLPVSIQGHQFTLTLRNVLLCPQLGANLMSGSQLVRSGARLVCDSNGSLVMNHDGNVVAELVHHKGLFFLHTWTDQQIALKASVATDQLWHERFCHLSPDGMKAMQRMMVGLDLSEHPFDASNCDACNRTKMNDIPHNYPLVDDSTKPFELIFSDVKGMLDKGFDGSSYWVTFLDGVTKYSEVYTIKYKSEVPYYFKQFKAHVERRGYKVLRLHSDGGGEYISKQFQEEMKNEGIECTQSTPHSQMQNGMAERLNRTIYDKAWPILLASGLPHNMWPEAVRYANYSRNRNPTSDSKTDLRTPYERFTNKKPRHNEFRQWGCPVWWRPGRTKKFKSFVDEKGSQGHFVGFESPHVVRILTTSGRITTASQVRYKESIPTSEPHAKRRRIDPSDDCESEADEDDQPTRIVIWKEKDFAVAKEFTRRTLKPRKKKHKGVQIVPTPPPPLVRRSQRLVDSNGPHKPRRFLHDDDEVKAMVAVCQRYQTHSVKPSLIHALLAAKLPEDPYEPKSWKSAQQHLHKDHWTNAAGEEYESLNDNETWELVNRPPDRDVLPGRWVFKYKRSLDGSVARYKARWVVKGDKQQAGVDFNETFASVVKPMSYKTLFAIAAALDLDIDQMDVKTAFLYGAIQEEVYVEQPHGFKDGTERVCRLKKALYGLKQSPRVWYLTLATLLGEIGFEPLDADSSVFVKDSTFIAIYVDDILIVGNDRTRIDQLKQSLSNRFRMTDLGPVSSYLGMKVTRDRTNRRLRLSQRGYIEEGIKTAGQWNAPPQLTPMGTQKLKPAPDNYVSPPSLKADYQSAVGTLMYAMLGTRPDIAFAVSVVSRYAANPTIDHMNAVLRVFSYLRGTLDFELVFQGELTALRGWSDSDWAGCDETRRSTSGFVFNLGSGAISWSSKRQPTVSLSTCEAEYKAMTLAAKEAVWLRTLLSRLIPVDDAPYATIIYGDNQGAIALTKESRFHARTKHIEIQHHWIREKVATGEIEMEYVHTSKMVADGMTKPLPRDSFYEFRAALGLERYEV